MKVLIDASQVAGGGAVQVALAMIANASSDREHQWHVAVSGELSDQVPADLASGLDGFTRLPKRRNALERFLIPKWHMPAIERRIAPDAVYTLFGPPYWRARAVHLVGFALGRMIYPELDQEDRHQQQPWWRRKSRALKDDFRRRQFSAPDYLVVESETVRARVQRFFGIDGQRIFVVPNSFSPVFSQELERLQSAPPEDRYRIAIPCSYYPHKNLGLVAPTAAALQPLVDRPLEFCFTLPESGAPWQKLRAQARGLGVENCLTTRGTLAHHDIPRLYRESHATFLPTLVECSTAVYPESFCAEIPLVTSDLDFARELCGPAACFIDPRCAGAAAEGLAKVLMDLDFAKQLVSQGRTYLQQAYPNPQTKWQRQIETIQRACLQPAPALI